MEIKHTKTEKGTAFVEAQVNTIEVDTEKNHVLDEMIKDVAVKGFRQGKAPKALAEKQVDPEKLSNHMLGHLMNHILDHVIEENKFRLLGRPVLEDLQTAKDGSLNIKLQLPLYPEVILGDYHKYLKTKKKNTIEDVYELLIKNEGFEVSSLIIDEEVNFSLERLTTQAKSLNLPLADYLKALKKTLEEVKNEYRLSAEKSVKLDILLLEIAKKEKIDTPEKELVELAKVSSIPERQLDQLRSIVNRRKTIDFLMKI